MHLGKLGQQFVLKSMRSFDRIRFLGYEAAESSEWYVKKMQRDTSARREYLDVERNRRQRGDPRDLAGQTRNTVVDIVFFQPLSKLRVSFQK